jgi:hypothetical protein
LSHGIGFSLGEDVLIINQICKTNSNKQSKGVLEGAGFLSLRFFAIINSVVYGNGIPQPEKEKPCLFTTPLNKTFELPLRLMDPYTPPKK